MIMNDEQVLATAKTLESWFLIKWTQVKRRHCYLSNLLEKGRFQLVRSYSTVVGLIDLQEEVFYEIGKYSPTTSKQVTMLYREQFSWCERHYVEGRV